MKYLHYPFLLNLIPDVFRNHNYLIICVPDGLVTIPCSKRCISTLICISDTFYQIDLVRLLIKSSGLLADCL